jgi:phenylpropionate dioxygenase-like ring-hydroxylating dioxygenase large terminal subunit
MRDAVKFLRNAWYVAMWSEDLLPGKLEHRRILGEPIVLFRSDEGAPIALADACAHRFAPLHLGSIKPGGIVQCVYHGLQFDRTGACVRNPHGVGRVPPSARVKSYPVVERHLALWIWMGQTPADPAEIPEFSHLDDVDPTWCSKRDWLEMEANYMLVADNLLDLSHASFLHDGILGSLETVPAKLEVEQQGTTLTVKRWMPNVPIPSMMELLFRTDDPTGRADMWMDIRWDKPGCLRNWNGVTNLGAPREAGSGIFGNHFLTPIDEFRTAYHFCAVRWNPRSENEEKDAHVRARLSELRRYAFEFQDQVVINGQQRNLRDSAIDTSRPALFEIDAGPVRCGRIMDVLLEQERDLKKGHSSGREPADC